jgi:hypothetical protein
MMGPDDVREGAAGEAEPGGSWASHRGASTSPSTSMR